MVVVGGGISGLATARSLVAAARDREHSLEVIVLEAGVRPGGKIRTDRKDGFTVEKGPIGFLDSAPRSLQLSRELGLEEELVRAQSEAKRRYLYVKGKLRPLPMSPLSFLTSPVLSLRGRLRVLREPWVRALELEEETVGEFARRRLGQEAAEILVAPMVLGVFAGDADRLSLRSSFPRLRKMELDSGSLIRGAIQGKKRASRSGESEGKNPGFGGTLTSYAGGMEALIRALADELGPSLRCSTRVDSIVPDGAPMGARGPGAKRAPSCEWRVGIDSGEGILEADAVLLACESFAAASLIRNVDPDLAKELGSIDYAPIVVIGLGYSLSSIPRPLDGFGFLAPREQGVRILGCLWESSVFEGRAPAGYGLLRVMVGGGVDPDVLSFSDDELVNLVRKDLRVSLGVSEEPRTVVLTRWPKGIPQYEVGHGARLERIETRLKRHPGLFLTGNAYRGVAFNQCIEAAESTASLVLDWLWRDSGPGRLSSVRPRD